MMGVFRFKQFVLEKQVEWGREITIKEISENTGLSRTTVSKILNSQTNRIDEGTIIALCKFFKVPPGPVPFIVYEPGAANEKKEA